MFAKQRPHLWQGFLVGLILAMMVLYFPPYARSFVGDDYVQLDYVLPFATRPFTALKLFDPTWLGWYYRPLQNIWFLLNRTLFFYEPFGYYWLGLLVHALATAVLAAAARRLGLGWPTAVACATLFAIHKHYVDVITWISAIAIPLAALFSLASLAAYVTAVRRGNGRWLPVAFFFFLLALLSHEETILLPPLLLLWRVSQPRLRRISGAEWRLYGLMGLLLIAYLGMQIMRPNPTISFSEDTAANLPRALSYNAASQFMIESLSRLLPVGGFASTLHPYQQLIAPLIGAALIFWFWRGAALERLGLAWAVLHLAFIYVALWTPRPELYAGRHIYQAWIGVVIALGGLLQRQAVFSRPAPSRRKKQRVWQGTALATLLLMVIALGNSISQVRLVQEQWAADAAEEESARVQLAALLPQIDETMHIFAYRFPITPEFLRSVLQVWYGRQEPYRQPFGPLLRLQLHGQATPRFYMLDWDENGRLYNLMPELQQRQWTRFIWSTPARLEILTGETAVTEAGAQQLSVAGPANDRRLSVRLDPPETGEWRSLAYLVSVPEGSLLETAVRRTGPDNAPLHLRARLTADNITTTLLEMEISPGDESWHDVRLRIDAYAGMDVEIRLEVSGAGNGYWANPRLTRE